MRFVYKPEGADPKSWDFDPTRLMNPEVETIEKHTGLTFQEWMKAVSAGSFTALHGLLYVLLKRSIPTLKWNDVQFCMADLDFEMDDDERADIIATLEAKYDQLDDTERAGLEQLKASQPVDYAPKAELTI